jgi:four helix bundle protein
MQNFRNLQVWRMAHAFVLSAYGATSEFPRDEQFGLTSQIRRAAVSIAANIAEGCGRGSDGDFARHLQIAIGSADELEYHLLLAADLRFISTADGQSLSSQLMEVRRMLIRLTQKLRSARNS